MSLASSCLRSGLRTRENVPNSPSTSAWSLVSRSMMSIPDTYPGPCLPHTDATGLARGQQTARATPAMHRPGSLDTAVGVELGGVDRRADGAEPLRRRVAQ